MKRYCLAFAIVLPILAGSGAGLAQDAKSPLAIAVVDGQVLAQKARVMKAAREEAEQLAKKFQGDFSNQESRLKSEGEELLRRRLTMPADEYDRQTQDLRRRAEENVKTANERRELMALSIREVQVKFRDEAVNVAKAIAVEEGYTLLLDRSAALHVAPQFDITEKVLARLDKTVADIKFEFPPKAKSGALR